VGLIPFEVNELTRAVNPIKLREYLAAGLSVVSAPLPEVKLYEDMVELADTPATFAVAVEKALASPASRRQERSARMAHETWPGKLDVICRALASSRPNRPATGS